MPKRSASGPPRGRRTSSPRSTSAGKSFTKRPDHPLVKPSRPGSEKPKRNSEDKVRRGRPDNNAKTGPGGDSKDFGKRKRAVSDSPFRSTRGTGKWKDEGKPGDKRSFKKSDSKGNKSSRVRKDNTGKSETKFGPGSKKNERTPRPFDTKRRDNDQRPPRDARQSADDRPKKFEERKRTPYNKEELKYSRDKRPFHSAKGSPKPPTLSGPSDNKIRLNKFIANSGVCSRREADELIKMGIISVNGKTVTELGFKINPGDEVRHEDKLLKAEKPVYILLNKPKGFLTTTADPQERNTVMHLIGNVVKERVYPVGRLDRNTTGLLLLTNDGDLAEKLMHPSYNVKKIYKVELDRALTKADAQQILEGVKLEEGRAMVDDLAIISDDRKSIGLEIHIGWNRVVRRIFESLEYHVLKLDRSVYAGLNKKDIGRGEWRFLKKEELVLLKHFK